EIVERRHDIGEADARAGDLTGLVDARGDQDGVVTVAQLGEAVVAADAEIQLKLDPAGDQQVMTPGDDMLFQLEIGDAVDEEAADPVVAVVDMDGVSLAAKLLGGGEAGRPGANDADRPAELAARQRRLDPARGEGVL